MAGKSPAEIIRSYYFVGDFTEKLPDRDISTEIFWSYPFKLSNAVFPIDTEIEDRNKELQQVVGSGRAIEHLNRGRLLYANGEYDRAKATWLAIRDRWGKNFEYDRRVDYFTSLAFLAMGREALAKAGGRYDDVITKGHFNNAATFLSWAMIVKEDSPDAQVDAVYPKGIYNLASIYWRYERYAGAYGAAEKGLNFLRRTGRTEYRAQFRRILAEALIKNRSYLDAVRALDRAIREDAEPGQAAAMFSRVGDIYFDLNNYELAEDAYSLAEQIDASLRVLNQSQMILRAESLFWLGQFEKSQKLINFALNGAWDRTMALPLDDESLAYASLRFADGYLARYAELAAANKSPKKRAKLRADAKLEYYNVYHKFPRSRAATIAKMREACLELPEYEGKNIRHARQLLSDLRSAEALPEPAVEIAWACGVASHAQHEKTDAMLDRVRAFAAEYPQSRFLRQLVDPVREVQANKINQYIKAGNPYRTVSFFEKNRKNLFPTVPADLRGQLFAAYADISQPVPAAEFWQAHRKLPRNDRRILRETVVAAELAGHAKVAVSKRKSWSARSKKFGADLTARTAMAKGQPWTFAYIDRLLNSSRADDHLPWITKNYAAWSDKDEDLLCNREFPLLTRLWQRDDYKTYVQGRIKNVITARLPQLFKRDEDCALGLLNLEAKALGNTPQQLAKRFSSRLDWPLQGGFLGLLWTVSEQAYKAGLRSEAKNIWQAIEKNAPVESVERRLAAVRLDPSKTVYEKLWD